MSQEQNLGMTGDPEPRKDLLTALIGAIAFVLSIIILFGWLLPFNFTPKTACLSNVKQMALASVEYATDNNDRLPPSNRWSDVLTMNWPQLKLQDPLGGGEGQDGYAFRRVASAIKVSAVGKPEDFPLIFDSILSGSNQQGEASTMPHPGRHNGMNTVGYLDGHVRALAMP